MHHGIEETLKCERNLAAYSFLSSVIFRKTVLFASVSVPSIRPTKRGGPLRSAGCVYAARAGDCPRYRRPRERPPQHANQRCFRPAGRAEYLPPPPPPRRD